MRSDSSTYKKPPKKTCLCDTNGSSIIYSNSCVRQWRCISSQTLLNLLSPHCKRWWNLAKTKRSSGLNAEQIFFTPQFVWLILPSQRMDGWTLSTSTNVSFMVSWCALSATTPQSIYVHTLIGSGFTTRGTVRYILHAFSVFQGESHLVKDLLDLIGRYYHHEMPI